MPVMPWLTAPPPAKSARRAPPSQPLTHHLPPTCAYYSPSSPSFSSSWSRRRHSPRRPLAAAIDATGGGPLLEPEQRDPLLLAALRGARLRDQESRSADPLFIDPYAAILLSHDVAHQDLDGLVSHTSPCPDHYRLATKYIDDKLLNLTNSSENIRQVVLLTDGMDTRPYRLSWPRMSIIYDVSPRRVFNTATQLLRGAGAKVPRNCVLLHTPFESPDLQEGLCKNGFNGNRLSLWVLQGLPLTSISFENLVLLISSLAAKGSVFVGHLSDFSDWTAQNDMVTQQDKLGKLLFTHGFHVSFVHYQNVAKDIGLDLASTGEQCDTVLFIAEQLRFSDTQVESFRMHFERIEEDADEEGFEEL